MVLPLVVVGSPCKPLAPNRTKGLTPAPPLQAALGTTVDLDTPAARATRSAWTSAPFMLVEQHRSLCMLVE
jgi:hypothetical protein